MQIWHRTSGDRQTGSERSYIGGVPTLPAGMSVPIFSRTSTQMTFFFQVELPSGHRWGNHIVSVFAATDYVDDETHIPKLPLPLAGAALDAGFFRDYQTFFAFLVFRSVDAIMAADYVDKVAFRALNMSDDCPPDATRFGLMHATPAWLLGDEAPSSFDGSSSAITFLFQTREDYEFTTVPGAPRCKVPNYSGAEGEMKDSDSSNYVLFVANELYFFGIEGADKLVHVVPQS